MNLKLIMILVGAGVMAQGCSPLAPRPAEPSQFFILTALPSQAAGAPAVGPNTGSPLTIGVGPIDFPEYLRRTQLVTRTAPNRIDVCDQRQWAEPLDRNFARVLAENLGALLNTQRIEKYPWPRNNPIDYQIEINVRHFEMTTDGQSQLTAGWVIKDGRDGKDLYDSETIVSTPAGTEASAAPEALSTDLGALSTAIAQRISALSQDRARTAAD